MHLIDTIILHKNAHHSVARRKPIMSSSSSSSSMEAPLSPPSAPPAPALQHVVLASSISICLGKIATHPLDTLKAKLQVQIGTAHAPQRSGGQPTGCQPTGSAVLRIVRQQGLRELYAGFPVAVLGSLPAGAMYMSSYELARPRIREWFGVGGEIRFSGNKRGASFATDLTAGLFAEAFSCLVWCPVDVLKERMQVGIHSMVHFVMEGDDVVYNTAEWSITVTRSSSFLFPSSSSSRIDHRREMKTYPQFESVVDASVVGDMGFLRGYAMVCLRMHSRDPFSSVISPAPPTALVKWEGSPESSSTVTIFFFMAHLLRWVGVACHTTANYNFFRLLFRLQLAHDSLKNVRNIAFIGIFLDRVKMISYPHAGHPRGVR